MQAIDKAWAFLVPLLGISIFSCCVFYIGSLLGLLYASRHEDRAMLHQKAIAYASIITVLLLDAIRSLWDSFVGSHFPVEITIPVLICAMIYGGRATFRMCLLRVQQELKRSQSPDKHDQ